MSVDGGNSKSLVQWALPVVVVALVWPTVRGSGVGQGGGAS